MITKEEAEKLYADLIQLRRSEVLEKSDSTLGLIERHHEIPRSCGGSNDESNLIALYAKEHFMAHVYLWIIHHDDEFHDQMTCALMNMIKGTKCGLRSEIREFILASEEYQQARKEFAKYTSKLLSDANKGEKNHIYGKHWYYDPETNECKPFVEGEQPDGWIIGRKFKDPKTFSKHLSECQKNIVWIVNRKLQKQKHIKCEKAEKLIATGEWEYGRLEYSEDVKQQIRSKTYNTWEKNGRVFTKHKQSKYPICLNCGKENSNLFSKCCCSKCTKEFTEKIAKEKLQEKHQKEAEMLMTRGYFDSQKTELYKDVVNRKQVRRYLETVSVQKCAKCGKEHVKLTIHAIDGNCRNLKIDNYEFLCRECYLNSGTAGFSGKSKSKR